MASNVLKIIIEAINKASPVLEKVRADLEKTTKSTDKFAKALEKQQNEQIARQKAVAATSKLVSGTLIAMGAVATGVLTASAKAAIDFETAFAGVAKTVDLGAEDMDRLSDSIRNMAKEMPVSTSELSKIMEVAGQLGIQSVPELEKFTKTIAMAGTAITEVPVEEMALRFAQIANVMDEPIENIDMMASVVVELGNKMKTGEAKIFNYAKRLGPMAKIAGLTTDELFGLSAGFASSGIEAEAGASAVQKALLFMKQSGEGSTQTFINNTAAIGKNEKSLGKLNTRLQKTGNRLSELKDKGKEGSATYKNLILDQQSLQSEIGAVNGSLGTLNATQGKAVASSSDFAKIIGVTQKEFKKMREEDPAGTFVKFLDGLKKLEDEGGDAAKALDDLGLGSTRALTAMLAGANTSEELAKGLKLAADEVGDMNALTDEYGKRLATTEAQMAIFRQNIADVAISIGMALLPAINKVMQALLPMIQRFGDFASEHPNLIAGILGVVAAIGGLTITILALGKVWAALQLVATAAKFKSVGAMITGTTKALGLFMLKATLVIGVVAAVALAIDQLALSTGITTERFETFRIVADGLTYWWQQAAVLIDNVSIALTGAGQSTRDLQTAEENLATARDSKKDLERNMRRQILLTEEARQRNIDAVENMDAVEKKYGDNSPEYEQAARDREFAQLNLEEQLERTNTAIDAYNTNEQVIVNEKDNITNALEQQNKDLEKHQGFWQGLKDKIAGAVANLKEYFIQKGKDATISGGSFAHGGVVPGSPSQAVPILAHGGEKVIPRTGTDSQTGTSPGLGGISISFNGPVNMDSGDRVRQLADLIKSELGRENELARLGMSF